MWDNKFFLFVIGLTFYIVINIGGEINISTLIILSTSFLWIKSISDNKRYREYAIYFVLLIIFQIISEFFSENNTIEQKIKGIAITIQGFIIFSYFFAVLKKDICLFKYFFLGYTLSFIFFIRYSGSSFMEATDLKFYYGPIICNVLFACYLWIKNRHFQNFLPYIIFFIGLLFIFLGARSLSIPLIFTSIFIIFIGRKKIISKKKIKRIILVVLTISYLTYYFIYVPLVESNIIYGGNTYQLEKNEKKENPFNLIKIGRADSLIPLYAFLDAPLWGWGYWANDTNYKYRSMLLELSESDLDLKKSINKSTHNRIPGHSVIFYYACAYGIIPFILLIILYLKILRVLWNSINIRDEYLLIRIYFFIYMTWHFFFSPMPHFKYLPLYFAFIIVSSCETYNNKTYRIR